MRKHRLIRFVAALLYIVAALILLAGIAAAVAFSRNGFGAGMGPGSSAWVYVPIVGAAFLTAVVFVVLASMLFFLARIDTNLGMARVRRQSALAGPARVPVIPAPGAVAALGAATASDAAAAPVAGAASPAAVPAAEHPSAQPPEPAAPVPPSEPAPPAAPAESGSGTAGVYGQDESAAGESEPPPATKGSPRLPGGQEAARIAAEMAALRASARRQAGEDKNPGGEGSGKKTSG